MLALQVTRNGQPSVVCGADDLAVLIASVSLAGRLGPSTEHPRPDEQPDMWLKVGGLTSRANGTPDEHLAWIRDYGLRVGDTITIVVVETENPAPPTERKAAKTER